MKDDGHRWSARGSRVRCRRCGTTAVLTREGWMRVAEETSPWDYVRLRTCDEETARRVLES